MDWLNKSDGFNASERRLAAIVEKSCLKLWTWPSPHYSFNGGKIEEICDVLAVMGNDVVIFSHKGKQFNPDKTIDVAWGRLYREWANTEQVFGAENTLKHPGTKFYTNSKGTTPLPVRIPSSDKIRFHRVIVTSGFAEYAKEIHKGGNGSLGIDTDLIADAHLQHPFKIGRIKKDDRYIHVIDEDTVRLILEELDTFKDFVKYLRDKEELIRKTKTLWAAGEEALLGYYLWEEGAKESRIFYHEEDVDKTFDKVIVNHAWWSSLKEQEAYKNRNKLNEKSYLWDALINCALESLTPGMISNGDNDYAQIARIMASYDRRERADLVQCLIDSANDCRPGEMKCTASFLAQDDAPETNFFAFLQIPPSVLPDYSSYLELRASILQAKLVTYKSKFPGYTNYVGIAMEPMKFYPKRSHHFGMLRNVPLTDEDVIAAENFLNKLPTSNHRLNVAGYTLTEFPFEDNGKVTNRVSAPKEVVYNLLKGFFK